LHDESFLEKLSHGLILSGIAMNIAGSSRPCSGSEHEISHAIDQLFPGTALHGQQVSVGTLIGSFLRGEDISHLIDFFARVKLPVSHKDLGLTDEQMVQVLLKAPETRPGRYTILEERKLDEKGVQQLLKDFNAKVDEYRS